MPDDDVSEEDFRNLLNKSIDAGLPISDISKKFIVPESTVDR